MEDGDSNAGGRAAATAEWQPGYATWAIAIYLGTIAGSIAASFIAPMLMTRTAGWGLPALSGLLRSEGAAGAALYLSMAIILVIVSVLPGLLSLFLMALTQLRLGLHPIAGGAFYAASAGWVGQSVGGALFGLIFGSVSLGVVALLLALRRKVDLSRRGRGRGGL
ncbi:MAG TPA: hypothetical protein VGB59_00390 [Allosphingosinicella sp.]|jgi:hypothetical protein